MLIVALDPPLNVDVDSWISYRFERLKDIANGFKIGLPAIVRYGVEGVAKRFLRYDGLLIADLKLADIGDIMSLTARLVKVWGFNAIIAHSFVGYNDGIEVLAKTCREEDIKLILVVAMSHRGSSDFIDKHIDEFIELAMAVESWGVVAPATRPHIVKYIRSRLGPGVKILSPGVGAQGAEPGVALCAGADYEIVGRAITYSEDVLRSAMNIIEQQKKRVSLCRG